MNDDFLDYYTRELDFIRKMGAEFAKAQPVMAGHLQIDATRCEDPHVERLLEAFAFLTARIRKKIDDEYPEISDALLSVLFPHYQRPLPSMAVVQFAASDDPTKTIAGGEVARGTSLTTRPIDGVMCKFRTAYTVKLWPVTVEAASLAPDRVTIAGKPPDASAMIRLELNCGAPEGWASLQGFESLRFYLDGGEPVPSSIYEGLFSGLVGTWIRGKTADGEAKTIVLPRDSVRPVGFATDEAMFDYPVQSFDGYRLLQEFFTLPAKFLFFDIHGLNRIARAGLTGPVEILFFLNEPPRTEVAIRKENFLLGCSPIINLFSKVADPIRLNQLQTSYQVIPQADSPHGYEVYSIESVMSTGSYLEESVEFEPFYSMKHSTRSESPSAYWFASRRASMRDRDDGTEVDLSFSDPGFNPARPPVDTVTVHLICSNRDLPTQLTFGGKEADFLAETEAPISRVRLLMRPTKPLRPPIGRNAQWRLISQLGLNHLSLLDGEHGPDGFRELLSLYDFADSAATRRMIDGLVGIKGRRVAGRTGNRLGNTLSLGLEVSVTFNEEAFAGSGAFVLASVLERFLGSYVTINSFTQMVALSKQREGIWKRWPPRCGDRTLL